jgi:hypothetical protein
VTDARILWRSEDRRRWFLVPANEAPPQGDLPIRSATDGATALVDRGWAARFETSEEEGRDWAKVELGATLGELKKGIDVGLAGIRQRLDEAERRPVSEGSPIALGAGPALLELLKSLPRVVLDSLSGNSARIDEARDASAEIEGRLGEAGLDLGGGLSKFPDRLAGLRRDFAYRKADEPPVEP